MLLPGEDPASQLLRDGERTLKADSLRLTSSDTTGNLLSGRSYQLTRTLKSPHVMEWSQYSLGLGRGVSDGEMSRRRRSWLEKSHFLIQCTDFPSAKGWKPQVRCTLPCFFFMVCLVVDSCVSQKNVKRSWKSSEMIGRMVCGGGNKEHLRMEYRITCKRPVFELRGHIDLCNELKGLVFQMMPVYLTERRLVDLTKWPGTTPDLSSREEEGNSNSICYYLIQ